ncbi:winged helix-turn-helix domain-containing protein [Paenibacillus sp. P96]|uniref:Winged helix-turn-helix domain-containing protein n=1 Tax=Paenibacillus zeirhizosphaerae TaxID=2987519 RepID=A0ABT9FX79_9BACL|nr:winged helix-turn-helix domain-containing protein [Paenibacillus sp. P96]MDP4099333.1 winged helix-turn-helix domain-containing protein [Paenibacillus sp. P96]
MNVALFTDEESIVRFCSYLFNDAPFTVFSRGNLTSSNYDIYSHIILGVDQINEKDWEFLRIAITSRASVYLMVQNDIAVGEELRAKRMGVANILKTPKYHFLREDVADLDKVFSQLAYLALSIREDKNAAPIYVGRDTFFHPEQLWVQHDSMRMDLTEKQAKLLQYFLDHEGKLVTKYDLANYIWGGYIKPEGIPKFISRLKEKLGPAGALITSRAVGGFLYIREK